MRSAVWISPLAAGILLSGCNGNPLAAGPRTREVMLPAGTELELMALASLSSDSSKVGDKVTFIVGESVKADGAVVAIPAGTKVYGEVIQARGANALSGLTNQPARLSVQFKGLQIEGGPLIALKGNDDKESTWYAFSREDGARSGDMETMREVMQDAATQQLFRDLGDAIERGENPRDLANRLSENPAFKLMLEHERMRYSKKFSSSKHDLETGVDDLLKAFSEVKKGNLSALGDADVSLILGAIGEMGSMVDDAENTIKGIFKGRNIRIPVGATIRLKTGEAAQWSVSVDPS